MDLRFFRSALLLGAAMALVMSAEAGAQTTEPETPTPTAPEEPAPPPAPDEPPIVEEEPELPPVEIITPAPEPEPTPTPVVAPAPTPAPPAPVTPPAPPAPVTPPVTPPPAPPEDYYGPPGGQAAWERSQVSAQSPINPVSGILPGSLDDFSSAGTIVTRGAIDQQEPLTTNDILQRVPGVAVINDDGLGRHGGISIRGAPARRSRKVLVMEDGRSINQSLWLDPSTHYVPPPERIESVEVLRGTVIVHGPNNNFGVVNFRNLQPFGPNESVASAQTGSVALQGPGLDGSDASKWHVHSRQTSGNWGVVLSYTGANAQGAWDTERLRFHDFYGALGWKGEKSDFTFTTVFFMQRDNYDESNLEGDDDDPPGQIERDFFRHIKQCKTCFDPGSRLNEYNANLLLMQGVYNYYVDDDTTVTARVYGQLLDRARFFNLEEEDPRTTDPGGVPPILVGDDLFVAEGSMEGRLRTFNHIGTELRTEFANRPFLWGKTQDIQVGVRYEHHEFRDRAFVGNQGQILKGFDSRGFTIWNRDFTADAFSTFLQTDIAVNERLNVVPGVRLEHYRISRLTKAIFDDDDEEEDAACGPLFTDFGIDECVVFEDFEDDPFKETFTRTHVLPGVAFAYGFGAKDTSGQYASKLATKPKYETTLYGGYNRGLTMGVLREVAFPPGDEIGNNFQLGLRSTAIKGFTFDVAGFHQNIRDFQYRSEVSLVGDRTFETVDEVHINGVEIYGRLDTRPYTGWVLNPYTEATYTLADSKVAKGFNQAGDSVKGNFVPEVPRQMAYLTLGVEHQAGWNASVSWIYRGSFFTDIDNTPFGGDPEGEDGEVPGVWLLAARINYTIPNTDATLFVSGENLANKLYITDREDGIKPGLGRTIMAGARVKW
jgi:Fe(3+) dicitrate transport protein